MRLLFLFVKSKCHLNLNSLQHDFRQYHHYQNIYTIYYYLYIYNIYFMCLTIMRFLFLFQKPNNRT